jgi:sugar (pentulose or hexulose) kinase
LETSAAVAGGAYGSIPEASAQMVRVAMTVEPSAAAHRTYADFYDLYCETYERLAPLLHRLTALVAANEAQHVSPGDKHVGS